MPLPEPHRGKFTYADYAGWSDDGRWELVEGVPFAMTPAPSLGHQRAVVRLAHLLEGALQGGPCTAFVAPVDVVLSEVSVVQPDVAVVCDREKLRPNGIFGAPDLVVEVLSPGTGLHDRRTKRDLYERHGVREYLLLDPEGRYAERFLLEASGGFGRSELFGPAESIALRSLGGWELRLGEVFEAAGWPLS